MADSTTELWTRPIPAVSSGSITEEHLPVLLWAHTGAATVEAGGTRYRIDAGEAIWIPPGVPHVTNTDEGAVVLPIFPRPAEPHGRLADVRVIVMPPGWEHWFVSQFDFNRYHTRGARPDEQTLLGLVLDGVAGSDRRRPAQVPPLPLPHSREAHEVAQILLRSPGALWPIGQLAERANVSVRTLQRQFRDETGMVLSEWRTRARVTVAAHRLADGSEIGWTGRSVGFATPAGFTKAFRRYFGVGPQEFARRATALIDQQLTDQRPQSAVEPEAEVGTELVALVTDGERRPPPIPARQTWSWVYDRHVLWWVYLGAVKIRIGTHTFALRRGEAIWLPAGIVASVDDVAGGSILLSLGDRDGTPRIAVDELQTFSFPPAAESYLLHTVVVENTILRPAGEHPRLADDLFRKQFAIAEQRNAADGLTGAVATIAKALSADLADTRSLADWAAQLGVSPDQLAEEFRTQAGDSFPRWRAHLRMTVARYLLMLGDAPSEVARQLGYAGGATFNKVFTAAHGISPRRYQQRVSLNLPAST